MTITNNCPLVQVEALDKDRRNLGSIMNYTCGASGEKMLINTDFIPRKAKEISITIHYNLGEKSA